MNELSGVAKALNLVFILALVLVGASLIIILRPDLLQPEKNETVAQKPEEKLWKAPDISTLTKDEEGELIRYGRDLIAETSDFLGPQGSVAHISNGMNCQNCHLQAGTKPFGNNYGAVASMYPKFRPRSGGVESIEKRVNDCIERSLNGKGLDSLSHEMRAIVAYIKWLGKDVPKGEYSAGAGLIKMKWLDRAADTVNGKKIFLRQCQICHNRDGQGQRISANGHFVYPPLWGENSFNNGAGLYRISNFARYVYANMPNGATFEKPILSQEESWDVAAYIISQPRPSKDWNRDWPKIESKPIDHAFGPYADKFTEVQHKYGPFPPIEASKK